MTSPFRQEPRRRSLRARGGRSTLLCAPCSQAGRVLPCAGTLHAYNPAHHPPAAPAHRPCTQAAPAFHPGCYSLGASPAIPIPAWQPEQALEPSLALFVPTAATAGGLAGQASCDYDAAAQAAQAGFLPSGAYPSSFESGPLLLQQCVPPRAAGGGLHELPPKARLRWSAALHARFVAAVAQLGGALRATPKRIQALMGVPGITLYHIKVRWV